MGRSSTYCFKIIACGSTSKSVDIDDLDASSENKGSDKRGWSFRKRSATHRVLSNTVATEIPFSENNENSESVIINYEAPISSSISEKISGNQWTEEKARLSTSTTKGAMVSNMVTKAAGEDVIFDSNPDESFIIIIQAAVRKFLAQGELLRRKKVVKLQAAVRGHLVRSHAAGTLRCILAIVRMQALVRARHERSSVGEKGTEDSGTKQCATYVSIEKLLSNRFASQLLESTPRTKQINIKCDPLKHDSAWKWLERWMSASSTEIMEQDKVDGTQNEIGNVIHSHYEETENLIHSEQNSYIIISHNKKPRPANTIMPDSTQKSDFLPEETKRPAKRVAKEQADSMGRKLREASDTAFIAAHSRFEVLTSKSNSLSSVSSGPENAIWTRDVEPVESLVNHSSRLVRIGGSECGTELSVTSTLDSPDLSEVGNIEYDKEAKVLAKEAGDIKSTSLEEHALLGTELTYYTVLSEKFNGGDEQLKPDDNVDLSQVEPETGRQVYKSSPGASPRSHVTVPESQGTLSSQLSSNNKTRTNKKVSSQKHKSWSNSKKSPVNSNINSGLRSSLELFPRDTKNGHRRKSFGSQTSDQIDQEPRSSSSSSSSLPSYMQATESARAKALANSSPRSSPDMHGKETYMKKRHSLPDAVNGPHIKRPMSQAQNTTNGNDNQESKWQK